MSEPFEVLKTSAGFCDGHPIGGRRATHSVTFRAGLQVRLCDECASDLRDSLPERPPKPERVPPETGEGKGPDFHALPVTPTRVRP